MEEIPESWNNTSLFGGHISYIINIMASHTKCYDIGPPRWNIGGNIGKNYEK
jgi:hypothetical protein